MNLFLDASVRAMNRHGIPLNYAVITDGAYNVETGTLQQVRTNYELKMYPKQIQANSYNFPNLIGKDVCMFYLANYNLPFVPSLGDEITYNGKVFVVQSYQEHAAQGQIVLYRVVGSKG